MLLSIVIPVYNVKEYLPQTVESLYAQAFEDFELLLINDGSTDGSDAICDQIAAEDSRVRVFHIPNGGVSAARNLGLMQAKGDYVHFMDSDDTLKPGMYCEFQKQARRNGPDIITCGVEYINVRWNTSESIKDTQTQHIHNPGAYLNRLPTALRKLLLLHVVNKWYRRTWLDENKCRFQEDVRFGEDMIFNCQVLQHAASISAVAREYYCYHRRGDGLTGIQYPEPWKQRPVQLQAVRALYQRYGIWEENSTDILAEERRMCFEALRSVNKPKCSLNQKQKQEYIRKIYTSDIMPLVIQHLGRSPKWEHRISCKLMQWFGVRGAYLVVAMDRGYTNIKQKLRR